jgi:hypothetical protein
MGDQRRIAILEHGVEIGRDVLLGLEKLRRVVAGGFQRHHSCSHSAANAFAAAMSRAAYL